MKKSLVLLPLLAAAVLAASCTSTPKKKKKKSSSQEPVPTSVIPGPTGTSVAPTTKTTTAPTTVTTVTPTTAPTTAPTTGTTDVPPGPKETQFNLAPGTHTVEIDLVNNYSDYKSNFPRVEADTGLYECTFAGLSSVGVGCFVSSYSGAGYLMMKNKDDYATNHGAAFLANAESLGNITSITVTTGSSASAKAEVCIYIGNSPIATEGGSSSGTKVTGAGTTQTVTGSGAYFCVTATNTAVNAQIGVLTVTYTI